MQQDDEKHTDEAPPQSGSQVIGTQAPALHMTAYDIDEARELLPDLNADELRRLEVAAPGSPLVENAKYIDLRHRERGELEARAGMVADDVHWYVLKKDIDYELWHKLLGTPDVKRTGTTG